MVDFQPPESEITSVLFQTWTVVQMRSSGEGWLVRRASVKTPQQTLHLRPCVCPPSVRSWLQQPKSVRNCA